MPITWDEPTQGCWRASDEHGRILARVTRTPLSTECAARVGFSDLGVYVSADSAKAAVERFLTKEAAP